MQSFLSHFVADETPDRGPDEGDAGSPAVDDFLAEYGGRSFGRGLYRTLRLDEAEAAREVLQTAFPVAAAAATPFGFDWLGRLFSLCDDARSCRICELGAGNVLEVPAGLEAFHTVEAVQRPQDLFAAAFYDRWQEEAGQPPLGVDEVAGYRVPLFLGGDDTVENLERGDRWDDWSAAAELWAEVRDLPPGTQVTFRSP